MGPGGVGGVILLFAGLWFLKGMEVITVAEDAPAPACEEARRKSRRLSDRLRKNNENAAPVAEGTPGRPASKQSLNRFGFKKRSLPVVLVGSGTGEQRICNAAAASTAFEPLAVTSLVDGILGDLDCHAALLRAKPTAGRYEWKGQIAELTETVKQLKGALRDQLERARKVSPALASAQEDVNAKLHALSEEARTAQASNENSTQELATVRKRAEERAKTIKEVTAQNDGAKLECASLTERATSEAQRADEAEKLLEERCAQLARATATCDDLENKVNAQEAAAKEAAAASQAAIAAATAECSQTQASLDATRAEAQKVQDELTTSRDAHAARAAELETQLRNATGEAERLREAHEKLAKEHAALAESTAATKARLEGVEAQLSEKTAVLTQKDADLRESLKTVTQMQKDHTEVIQHERQRSQALEEEARSLRTREQEAIGARTAAEADTERVRAELEMSKQELSTTQTSLQHATTERERLAIETAERHDELVAQKEACSKLEGRLSESQEQLASVSATLAAKKEEAESLSIAKHEMEVEYKSYKEHHSSSNQEQMSAISELKLTVDRLSDQVEKKSVEVNTQQGSLAQQGAYLETLEAKLREQETLRRALHNTIQELKGNIRVFCRVRPAADEAEKAIELSESNKLSLAHGADPHVFGFDKVFSPSASQEAVFAEVDGLVQSSLDGYKVCIFAYGQTGSGKTFTMQGGANPDTWGLIPRALSKILSVSSAMKADGWTWSLQATFLEIYNETLRDLLHEGKGAQPSYAIKHDEAWGTVVANMARVEVDSMEQINALMKQAAKARAVGCTDMNSQSSRSHSVFALYLKGTNSKLNTELHGALHLVDLAGSERLDKSGAVGAALKETQAINKSLSSLADVFNAKSTHASHVPFRNSKLTHLMEPCLSGHGKTLMVVNVAPEQQNAHESLCSLRFAKQVNQCDTGTAQARQPKRHAKPTAQQAAPAAKQARPQSAAAAAPASKRALGK